MSYRFWVQEDEPLLKFVYEHPGCIILDFRSVSNLSESEIQSSLQRLLGRGVLVKVNRVYPTPTRRRTVWSYRINNRFEAEVSAL